MTLTVAIHGDGQLARGVAARLASRPDVRVLGPARRDQVVLASGADLVLVATTTRLRDVADDVRAAVSAGSNVLVSAEEAAYPWVVDRALAEELDALAVARGVSILGGGLNPGFLFDAFVLTLLGAHDVPRRIAIERVVDVSRFGAAVRARLGLGRTPADFERQRAAGEILGHAGFAQSMHVVAAAIGRRIDRLDAEFTPIFAAEDIELPGYRVAAGETAGFEQRYTAVTDGAGWFTARFLGHVRLADIGQRPTDRVVIDDGHGERTAELTPGVPSQDGSIAVVVNSIDRVVAAAPGWRTVADLPPARPHPRGGTL